MQHNTFPQEELQYRVIYGKLFSGLLHHFGTNYVSEIEDAIQNAFLKSLKSWKQDRIPSSKENWLFIVARNDVLDQLKRKRQLDILPKESIEVEFEEQEKTDLRLQTLLLLCSLKSLSNQAKILYILKNIFGLGIHEIAECTLLNPEAIYKSLQRTKENMQNRENLPSLDVLSIQPSLTTIALVEEILYAVFTIGFDSFNEKKEEVVNEDLCLEAFALTKLLLVQHPAVSTSNLFALFCFHMARLPAKLVDGKLISFFNQDRERWNNDLLQMGFRYLQKPTKASKYYLEAVILSKYMTLYPMETNDWADIVQLYESMYPISHSPMIKLNLCFCLYKMGNKEKASQLLSEIESELPNDHLYFSLVKAKMIKELDPTHAEEIWDSCINQLKQQIRKNYLMENRIG
jgi:RNA polymerase sigma-70 factor (ECF subfamily)